MTPRAAPREPIAEPFGPDPLTWRSTARPVVVGSDLFVLCEGTNHIFEGPAYAGAAALLAEGRHAEEDLLCGLERAGVAPLSARLALAHLRARALVSDAGSAARVPASEAAFWEGLGLDAVAARDRVRAVHVGLAEVGGTGHDVLERALRDGGLTVREDGARGDLTIVVADDTTDDRLAAFNRAALDFCVPWMLVRLVGSVPWIGPLFVPGETGCWTCLTQRLVLNQQTERFVASLPGPSAPPLPATSWSVAVPAAIAAVEVLRWAAGNRHGGVVGGLLALDLTTNALVRHPLVRRPQCSACGPGSEDRNPRRAPTVELGPSPRRGADSRAATAADTFDRFAHHVSPLTGAVRGLREVREHGYLQVAAAHAFPMHRYDARVLRDNLSGRSGGKGFDPVAARTSALCEALERYSGMWQGEEEPVLAATPRRALGEDALDIATLLGFSTRQYVKRGLWNDGNDDPNAWVPHPFDEDRPIDWVPLASLSRSRTAWAPAAFCYYGHPDLRHQFCVADSNGCAAGTTTTEAVAYGLLELVERDAAAIWWYNRGRRPAVDLHALRLPVLDELGELFAGQGRTFWALDLTTDLGIPVVAAVSARSDGPTEDLIYGFGADVDLAGAATKALLEMNQSLFSVWRDRPGEFTHYRTSRTTALRWFRHATRERMPYLVPDPDATPPVPAPAAIASGGDWRINLVGMLDRLRERGLEAFVLDQTRADIGLPVARVVVPGLCHFWRRLGSHRLYEVPVQRGEQLVATAEADLNPWLIYF